VIFGSENAQRKNFKFFKAAFDTAPAKCYSAVNKGWFVGHKLHVIIHDNGVVQQSVVSPKPMYMTSAIWKKWNTYQKESSCWETELIFQLFQIKHAQSF
jgi:hypothetical protein